MNILSKSNKLIDSLLNFNDKGLNSYNAITSNIEVTVWPEFIDNQSNNLFIWAYHIRIENRSAENIKLLSRYWKIIDENGIIQEINGEGVIGEKPLIKSGEAFQYSSGVHLRNPSGIMLGHYTMQRENGELIEIKIPAFSLDAPNIKSTIN